MIIKAEYLSDILREVEKDNDNEAKSLKIAYSTSLNSKYFACMYKSLNDEIMIFTSQDIYSNVEELKLWNDHLNNSITLIEV